jgi:ABC-type branched-subunit amino acid transport system substrate-binding protein
MISRAAVLVNGRPRFASPIAVADLTGIFALALVPSCSTTFHAKACSSDAECGPNLVCERAAAQGSCIAAADSPLRIGMSAPITGPSQELGIEMRKGILLAFDGQNAAGGVHGRKIELDFRDDQYQPDSAEAAARDLLDVATKATSPRCPTTATPVVAGDPPVASTALDRGPNAVLGLVGSVGTPTMVRSAPIAVETGSLFFGAFTGAAKVLRDDMSGACHKYIFNVRASYAQEARATLEYFFKLRVPDARHLVSFDQNDSFGQAGYDGLGSAYAAITGAPPVAPIARFRYTRDDQSSVPAQIQATTVYLAQLLGSDTGSHVVGVFMTDTYGPATAYIRGVRDWQYATDAEQTTTNKAKRLTLYFSNVSFVGPNALASRLKDAGNVTTPSGAKSYADGVFVSQVVPNYESDDSDGVRDYRQALAAANETASFTSLEGYLAGRVFVAGLVAHDGPFTPDALVSTFEHLPRLNLGLGASSGFTADDHNYSKSVFGTAIQADGGFVNSYFWSDGNPIQLFE